MAPSPEAEWAVDCLLKALGHPPLVIIHPPKRTFGITWAEAIGLLPFRKRTMKLSDLTRVNRLNDQLAALREKQTRTADALAKPRGQLFEKTPVREVSVLGFLTVEVSDEASMRAVLTGLDYQLGIRVAAVERELRDLGVSL